MALDEGDPDEPGDPLLVTRYSSLYCSSSHGSSLKNVGRTRKKKGSPVTRKWWEFVTGIRPDYRMAKPRYWGFLEKL